MLQAHPWLLWLTIALLSGVAEVTLPNFTFIFAACGALVAALASLWLGPAAQIASFSLATVASLVFARPWLQTRGGLPSRTDVLIGRTGTVTTILAPHGRVLVDGEDWAARADVDVDVGQTIQVTGADGIVLAVKEV